MGDQFWFWMWIISIIILLTVIVPLADWGLRQYDDLCKQRRATVEWRKSSQEWQTRALIAEFGPPVEKWPDFTDLQATQEMRNHHASSDAQR